MSKDMGKRSPQLYYIKMNFFFDLATFLIYLCVSLYQDFFLRNCLREYIPKSVMAS